MRYFPHNFIVSRGWDIGKHSMDSLWLVPLPEEDGESEDGGAVSLRPAGPCSKLFGRIVGDAQEKVPVFDVGTAASHDMTQVSAIDEAKPEAMPKWQQMTLDP